MSDPSLIMHARDNSPTKYYRQKVWVRLQARYFTGFGVMFLLVTTMLSETACRCNTEWISGPERFKAMPLGEVVTDAIAALAETIGGHATQWGQLFLSVQQIASLGDWRFSLQMVTTFLEQSKGAHPSWWTIRVMECRGMYHEYFMSNLVEGSFLIDYAADRHAKDLAQVMRITLPYFREMKARIDTLSELQRVGYSSSSSDPASISGQTNTANLDTCLDIAESVAKMVPVFGDVLEGACGVVRKIVNAAEQARAARDECKALAEHTACITLAILNELGSRSSQPGIPNANIFDLCATIGEVERKITRISTLGRFKYFRARGRINNEVKDLRARVDNARIAFKIRSDISTAGLLYDLRMSQTRLASRVEDIYVGQQTTHHMLHTLLVEVRGAY